MIASTGENNSEFLNRIEILIRENELLRKKIEDLEVKATLWDYLALFHYDALEAYVEEWSKREENWVSERKPKASTG